jgi:hypothetical protein
MNFPSFENAKLYAMLGGLAAVLILLAALQYQSSKQLSQATTEQMLANLGGTLMNLRQGLEDKLTPLCRELEQSEAESRETSPPDYGSGLERWRRAAEHPELATGLYLWQPARYHGLLQLDLRTNKFEAIEWPSNLIHLRQRLQEMTPKQGGPREPILLVRRFPKGRLTLQKHHPG